MQYKILKTILALSLVSSSSMAIAEGKYTAKFPLKGVKASPTFGMTQTEKQEHEESVEMCSNQYNEMVTGYSRYSNYTYARARNQHYHVQYEIYVENVKVISFNSAESLNSDMTRKDVLSSRAGDIIIGDLQWSGSIQGYNGVFYEVTYPKKTDDYDWCIDNGYQTS